MKAKKKSQNRNMRDELICFCCCCCIFLSNSSNCGAFIYFFLFFWLLVVVTLRFTVSIHKLVNTWFEIRIHNGRVVILSLCLFNPVQQKCNEKWTRRMVKRNEKWNKIYKKKKNYTKIESISNVHSNAKCRNLLNVRAHINRFLNGLTLAHSSG